MLRRNFLTLLLFFAIQLTADVEENDDEGFPFWTVVQTEQGNKRFNQILKYDMLMTFADNKVSTAYAIEPETSDGLRTLYRVYIGEEVLTCGGATRFFVANKNEWVKAVDLEKGNLLISNKDNKPKLIECKGWEETCFGDVLLKIKIESPTRCYFVGQNSVLVHNHMPELSITFSWAFGEGAVAGAEAGAAASSFFSPLTIGVGAAIGGIGGLLWVSNLGESARPSYIEEAENLHFDGGDFRTTYESGCGSGGIPEDPKDPKNKMGQSATGKPPKNNLEDASDENIKKRIRGQEKQVRKHEQKLEDYKKEPDAHDNKEFLKNARNPQERQERINTRINELNEQIEKYKREAQKLKDILHERGAE